MKLFSLLILTFLSLNLYADISQIQKEEIDKIFADWDKPKVPGGSLGIIQDGKLIYTRGYGMANLEYDIPNDTKSVFRIGSTSKQFTAACIILLSLQDKLKLSDTLDKFFPDFPSYAKTISIQHLLNHTSGIRDYLTLATLKGLRADDYYDDKDVMQWLVKQQIDFKPGDKFLYSNSGYWLLGQIVNKVAEMNMSDFAEKEIFKPLGMNNTHFHNDHNHIVKNRASGYYPKSEDVFKISMTTLDMIGDGGIYTTIEDILLWDNTYYQSNVLNKEFWELMTKKAKLNNSKIIGYALGLGISTYKGLKTISHAGGFAGFRAELARFPEQHISIALFSNRGDTNTDQMVYKVADIILKDKFIKNLDDKLKTPKKTDAEDTATYSFNQIIGNYQLEPGVAIEITIKDKTLHAHQSWNDKSYIMEKINNNTYQIIDDPDFKFTFVEFKDNLTQLMIGSKSGRDRNTNWKRKAPIDLTKLNFNDYIGKFYSPELEVIYTITLKENQLFVNVKNKQAEKLIIENIDNFIAGYSAITFERNGSEVSGFIINVDGVKNLQFKKL